LPLAVRRLQLTRRQRMSAPSAPLASQREIFTPVHPRNAGGPHTGLNHEYMAQPGAPPAAWQGPLFKEHPATTNSTIRLEHRNSVTPASSGDLPSAGLPKVGIERPELLRGRQTRCALDV
jgi:hypothetical protein